mmetsp:Transcript_34932/g.72751  ORF Transcript_34932/g.72751 Transcript_34932/m.72751 type:complete len:302 (+) Transcript_34932:59-964(+)
MVFRGKTGSDRKGTTRESLQEYPVPGLPPQIMDKVPTPNSIQELAQYLIHLVTIDIRAMEVLEVWVHPHIHRKDPTSQPIRTTGECSMRRNHRAGLKAGEVCHNMSERLLRCHLVICIREATCSQEEVGVHLNTGWRVSTVWAATPCPTHRLVIRHLIQHLRDDKDLAIMGRHHPTGVPHLPMDRLLITIQAMGRHLLLQPHQADTGHRLHMHTEGTREPHPTHHFPLTLLWHQHGQENHNQKLKNLCLGNLILHQEIRRRRRDQVWWAPNLTLSSARLPIKMKPPTQNRIELAFQSNERH